MPEPLEFTIKDDSLELELDSGQTDMELELEEESAGEELEMGEVQQVTTSDHRELSHRDKPDQHPMSAITGLEDALDEVDTDTISNTEIDALWKQVMMS